MKEFSTYNPALPEVLAEHGIEILCDSKMRMIISDSDAEQIPGIVEKYAPAALMDYCIEDLEDAD